MYVVGCINRKRWSDSCSVGAGLPGYRCRLDQVMENEMAKDWLDNSDKSPGKRSALGGKRSLGDKPADV
jgi:hypothetical protein